MPKEVMTNGVSLASTAPPMTSTAIDGTYQRPATNPQKKHITFAQNSCHPMNNSMLDVKHLNTDCEPSIDLCQKRWFLILLICLATIAAFNLSVTFWIINVLRLTDTGIGFGSVALTNKGVDISADIGFDGSLGARLIKSLDTKQNLVLNSDAKLVINNNQYVDNALTLGDGKLEVQSNSFQIRSTNPLNEEMSDEILFDVESNQISTYAKNFVEPTLGGHKIVNSLETDAIKGGLNHDLRVESRTQSVNIRGDNDIHLESKGGDVLVQSFDSTLLEAKNDIVVDSQRVDFRQLPRYQRPVDETNGRLSYQLCLCETGVMFAADANGVCKSDADWCLISSEA